jgi:hypothetical protein
LGTALRHARLRALARPAPGAAPPEPAPHTRPLSLYALWLAVTAVLAVLAVGLSGAG